MKMKLLLFSIYLIVLVLPNILFAKGKVTFVDKSDSNHPTYEQSTLSVEEVEDGMGKESHGAETVVVEKDGSMHWTQKSIKQLDKELGGDGNPEVKLDFDKRKIIDLFPDQKGIEPFDGKWKRTYLPLQKFGQCPDTTPPQSGLPKHIRIHAPFHPNQIKNPQKTKLSNKHTKWRKTSTNKWEASFVLMHKGASKADGVWKLTIVSKTKMELKLGLYTTIDVPAAGLHRSCGVVATAIYKKE